MSTVEVRDEQPSPGTPPGTPPDESVADDTGAASLNAADKSALSDMSRVGAGDYVSSKLDQLNLKQVTLLLEAGNTAFRNR